MKWYLFRTKDGVFLKNNQYHPPTPEQGTVVAYGTLDAVRAAERLLSSRQYSWERP